MSSPECGTLASLVADRDPLELRSLPAPAHTSRPIRRLAFPLPVLFSLAHTLFHPHHRYDEHEATIVRSLTEVTAATCIVI